MILSNVELQKALDDRRLIITPEPQPRRPSAGGLHCPYDTHSVDLTLGEIISIPEEGAFIYDPTLPKLAATITRNSRPVHPGWSGPSTLEMINLGAASILLRPGMPIAQLIVEEVKGTLFENPSDFRGQSTPPGI